MLNYSPENQSRGEPFSIFDFKTQFETKLDPQNRWVKLANLLNWDALAKIYATTLSSDMGAKAIDARVVLGALIIKHLEKKDDRGTIEIIQENHHSSSHQV